MPHPTYAGTALTPPLTEPVTAEELALHPEWNPCELVRGKVVPMSPTHQRHGEIAALLVGYLFEYVRARQAGRLYTAEAGFILERDPDTVRAPDVMFVRAERLPAEDQATGYLPVPPDLAVEIISPSDKFGEVMAKAHSYLGGGVGLVWVVDPQAGRVYVFEQGNKTETLSSDDVLKGGDVLPGFELPLKQLFTG